MLTLLRCPFRPRVTTVARKRPRLFCRKRRWQVTSKHAYTLDPTKSQWADYVAVHAWCRKPSGSELTRNLSGNTRPQSSQLTEPLWTDPGLKSGNCVRQLISTLKKKRRRGMNSRTFSQNPRKREKSHHHHHRHHIPAEILQSRKAAMEDYGNLALRRATKPDSSKRYSETGTVSAT